MSKSEKEKKTPAKKIADPSANLSAKKESSKPKKKEEDDDDDDYGDVDFNIVFSTPADFEELTEDWHIISISNTKIELTHVSGGNGGTDFLTFERN